ncbi:hypothetical protein M408DRAFT_193558 [Serendipita vermifera MAFF 305830]|uniref:Cytochrome P450 n=1 Tax=Serendipita vermifera MAFF 305830 TaxID=933852 RepID=A0A0C2XBC6_SERVB|nr:hypothetical protein M408DRAFT_193558 [Serendipita vermifera MAFF 305830]
MTTNKGEFVKPVEMYIAASLYGPNLVASESDEWKRHRKIAAPSFSERNNRLVYDETTRITTEIFESWSNKGGGETVKVDNALTLTSKLALMVISAAGFGMRSGWEDAEEPPTGHKMTFPTAMSTVLSNFVIRLVFSDTMLNLWQGGRKVATAFKELHVYMREMIEERRQSAAAESDSQADLFTNLINGTSLEEEEKDGDGLTDEELMGNVFIFLFAGHETTAHSIAFTLALLATHQDIQEKAFGELRSIVPEGEIPTYAHVVKWSYGLACIYESLRLYSPVVAFPKKAAHDTVVATYSADEKNTPITVPIPKGSGIMINVVGLHYNPKYWDEPEVFRPERFLGDYNRDAFMPFAAGPRACIGRRFSEVEAITVLAHLLLNYRFKPTPLNDAETPAEMKERLLRWRQGALTMGPEKVPLTFTRRHK